MIPHGTPLAQRRVTSTLARVAKLLKTISKEVEG
jgi:hypothetical protein